jgi:hypothetical protein
VALTSTRKGSAVVGHFAPPGYPPATRARHFSDNQRIAKIWTGCGVVRVRAGQIRQNL